MTEQYLNKKLAEWAGFHLDTSMGYWYHELPYWYEDANPPNFTQSLDACFKWLVPKLQLDGWLVSLRGHEFKGYDVLLEFVPRDLDLIRIDNNNPALTLCLAVEKLIDE